MREGPPGDSLQRKIFAAREEIRRLLPARGESAVYGDTSGSARWQH